MMQDPDDKPSSVGSGNVDGPVGTAVQKKAGEERQADEDGTLNIIIPPAQIAGSPPMESPKRDSWATPHPAMQLQLQPDADLELSGQALAGSDQHHHLQNQHHLQDQGLSQGQDQNQDQDRHRHIHRDSHLDSHLPPSHPASSSDGYIKPGFSPSREATGGEQPYLDLKTAAKPDFNFGSTATAFTAGDALDVVSPTTSPLKTFTSPSSCITARPPTTTTITAARRTIADRTAHKQAQADKMLFSDLYKSPKSPLTKFRNSLPHPGTIASSELDPDLVSRDKSKTKEAVKRFLAEKIRDDWDFTWPLPTVTAEGVTILPGDAETTAVPCADAVAGSNPAADVVVSASASASAEPFSFNTAPDTPSAPKAQADEESTAKDSGEEADSESDTESVYSVVSEDAVRFRPRAEWTSDLSDSEKAERAAASPPATKTILSPFRFDTPDSVGAAVRSAVRSRQAKRRRALRDEVGWNDGLACFVARRDAWTGAKTVRVKPSAPAAVASPISPTSARRLSFWRTVSHTRTESASSQTHGMVALAPSISAPAAAGSHPLSPTTTHGSNASDASEPDAVTPPPPPPPSSLPVETLLPLAPPLLPAANSMRASIVPGLYVTIYERVVQNSMQPSCPINLSDMIRSCVVGWKRDGEWPPRAAPPPEISMLAGRRRKKQSEAAAAPAAAQNGGHARKKSFVGLLTRVRTSEEKEGSSGAGKEEEGAAGKGIRRSIQKVFMGLGHHGQAHEGGGGEQVAAA